MSDYELIKFIKGSKTSVFKLVAKLEAYVSLTLNIYLNPSSIYFMKLLHASFLKSNFYFNSFDILI